MKMKPEPHFGQVQRWTSSGASGSFVVMIIGSLDNQNGSFEIMLSNSLRTESVGDIGWVSSEEDANKYWAVEVLDE